ncbi:MAG: Xaa-Pro peptidase family protein [Candidatus Latescibacterota bacterium]
MKLTPGGCRQRQQRLAAVLQERGLVGALLSRREHVLYFTGFLHPRHTAAGLCLSARGHTVLVGAGVPAGTAVDDVVPYEAGYHATLHSRQHRAVAEKLATVVPRRGRLGVDLDGGIAAVAALARSRALDLSDELLRLRKRKLPDEVDAIRAAIGITDVMYSAAKAAAHPGADEVEVLARIRCEATRAAGEDLEHFGNDFRANAAGGPARRRRMQAGELYILDAGPSLHGYFADNCRTFAVDRSPTRAQVCAWQLLDSVFAAVEGAARPGMRAVELYRLVDGLVRAGGHPGLVHHLGHGIGLAPHESPQLNPEYDAVLEAGDVFTVEPGVYAEDLQAGVRLEEDYLLTGTGVERLTHFPRGLV